MSARRSGARSGIERRLAPLVAVLLACGAAGGGALADEGCDDEGGGAAATCRVTRITLDLDTPVRTATFWGMFCPDPTVTLGTAEGTREPVTVLASAGGFVTIDLVGHDDPADHP
jgi:hypothetical protein